MTVEAVVDQHLMMPSVDVSPPFSSLASPVINMTLPQKLLHK